MTAPPLSAHLLLLCPYHCAATELIIYQRVLKDKRTPARAKVFLARPIDYFCMPFDLIPDFIPVIGHLDDAVVIPALVLLHFARCRARSFPSIGSGSRENEPFRARSVPLPDCLPKSSGGTIRRVKHWEIIADNLSKAGWSWGCGSAVDSNGRTIFVADAHRGDGKRFVVRADEKLTAFTEAEAAVRVVSLERPSERASLGTNRSELRTNSVRLKLKQRYDLHSWTRRSRHDHESIIC